MKTRYIVMLAVGIPMLVIIPVVVLVLILVFSPATGHKKAEAEYSKIISSLKSTMPSGASVKCATNTSSSNGAGLWFEQSQSLECSYPADYGQCVAVKELFKSKIQALGYTVDSYNENEYLVHTETSVGSISNISCTEWEQPEPNRQVGVVKFTLQEKD